MENVFYGLDNTKLSYLCQGTILKIISNFIIYFQLIKIYIQLYIQMDSKFTVKYLYALIPSLQHTVNKNGISQ